MKQLRSQSGFTAIELVIAITIASVLSVVAFEKYGDIATKATENSEKSVIAAVQTGVDLQNMQDVIDNSRLP